jgi:SAM-dependent methyltransferase
MTVLSLGRTPLANSLLRAEDLAETEPTFPLELAFCDRCSLVQITETIPPAELFRDYPYFSSFSDAMVLHARQLAEQLIADRSLDSTSFVVEAASNDGYLLQFYVEHGIGVLGIEPALNVAQAAERRGVPTLTEFFDVALAERLVTEHGAADVFHAHNVLAHVPDLNGFVEGIARVLAPDGVAVIEVPYVRDMIDRCEFDTIYHEHLCYFSLTALARIFERQGLAIADVERVAVHGGSLRVLVTPPEATRRSDAVDTLLAEEHEWGVHDVAVYERFAEQVAGLRESLVGLLRSLKADGKRVAAYGAAAKGSTLLNVFGIGAETLDFVVDRSTAKQGLFMPGVKLPIVPPERLLDEMPDYLLLLAWNWADEIMEQQQAYQERGGRFIVPVPQPEVIAR